MQQSAKLKYKGSLYPVHRLVRLTPSSGLPPSPLSFHVVPCCAPAPFLHPPRGLSHHLHFSSIAFVGSRPRPHSPPPYLSQDRVTSGIVLVAKTEAAARALTRAFRARTVTKYYCAISDRYAKGLRMPKWRLARPEGATNDPSVGSPLRAAQIRTAGGLRRRWAQSQGIWPARAAGAGSCCTRGTRLRCVFLRVVPCPPYAQQLCAYP